MAYLNTQEREDLLQELIKLNYMQAKRKIRNMDQKSRLGVFRNVQGVNRWVTRYELPSLGTKVTLIETYALTGEASVKESDFELTEVIVEPTAENRT
ncbi:MAG: hypothetical protein RLP44_14810 [Aggregatilineales bacterium]